MLFPSEDILRCWLTLEGIWPFILTFVVCTLLSHNCPGNYYAEEIFDMLYFQLSKFFLSNLSLKISDKGEKAYFLT